jgi:hypothetical protein
LIVSNRNHSWVPGWWMVTRRLVERLTASGDTAGCDREVERLVRESRLSSLARRMAATIGDAWRQSGSRAITLALVNGLMPAPAAAAIRAAGWTMTVASATALTLNVFRPQPPGPLTWVVPAVIAAAGVVMMAASAPLARAFGGRQ